MLVLTGCQDTLSKRQALSPTHAVSAIKTAFGPGGQNQLSNEREWRASLLMSRKAHSPAPIHWIYYLFTGFMASLSELKNVHA